MNDRPHRLRIAATLPIRSLDDGKRRLAGRLSPEQRRKLIISLARRVAEVLRTSGVIDRIGLVSGDDGTLAFGQELGLEPIWEERHGLNPALETAGAWARECGTDAHLIVLPDLPLLSVADVQAVADAAPDGDGIVACADRAGTGTNLLLMRPCGIVTPAFGPGSFARHLDLARNAGLAVATYGSAGTRWDVDTPDDLAGLGFEF